MYAKLLALYPKRYRQEYKAQMLLMAEDMLAAAASEAERRLIWLRLFRDLPGNLYHEHSSAIGSIMNTEDERRFKKMVLLSVIFILIALGTIMGYHLVLFLGGTKLHIGTIVLVIAVLLPLISSVLSLTALQQIHQRLFRELTPQQRRHKVVLIIVCSTSMLVLVLAAMSLLFTHV